MLQESRGVGGRVGPWVFHGFRRRDFYRPETLNPKPLNPKLYTVFVVFYAVRQAPFIGFWRCLASTWTPKVCIGFRV